jgi:hypothetical protein
VCVAEAIADAEGSRDLHLAEGNKMMHSLVQRQDTDKTVRVRTTTLDGFLQRRGITHVDLVKLDIEGAEGLALLGMRRMLTNGITHLLTEFSPSRLRASGLDPLSILHLLRDAGFDIYRIDEKDFCLRDVGPFQEFIDTAFTYKLYTNLFCTKDRQAVQTLFVRSPGSSRSFSFQNTETST